MLYDHEAGFIWTGRRASGAEYVDAIRSDLNDRLARLGVR
jgi:hypothetical protein